MTCWLVACCLVACCLAAAGARKAGAAEFKLRDGETICLVGNALGERMQHQNYWETLLHQTFPKKNLVVRNLCFPGDEPLYRLRSLNFGSPDKHLAHSKATTILFFFGYVESFHKADGVKPFIADLKQLIRETRKKNYSGKGPPQIVLVSPIAFEETGDANLPRAEGRNKQLATYAAAMQTVSEMEDVVFVDLFRPTQRLFAQQEARLTLNGAHLNAQGYRALAPILMQGLFGRGAKAAPLSKRLRAEIADKNFHWWHRYRAVNGYSIYGTRGNAGFDGSYRNRDVMERERAILDQMCANRDQRIWKLAQGQSVPAKADDSNTLPFIQPKTNVGGANDPNRKRGKLGSLDYLPAAEQIKRFRVAAGYEVQLVATEEDFPELANPVALNFDNQGRLWVAVMPSYPQWQPKTKMDDKLLILEDRNGDGRADNCKVFAGGLHQPTGFEIGRNGVYVAQQPDILYLRDTDGDDRADVRIRQLVGFDTADSHHGLAAFEWGPGGGLYFQEGTFKQSQVESPYGVHRLSDAGTWRYDPRTERFGVHVSCAFANPWGHVFDRWGQNFIADASPGFNYWAAPISGYVPHPDKHPGGGRMGRLDWGGSKSNRPMPRFIKKRTRPSSGCEIVSSRNFPPEAQGNFLVNNVIGDRAVLQHKVREQGSGFVGTEIERLISCEDGNFRPVDLQFGPDGALYIVDWHNALIGHLQHNLREPNRDHRHGRIWRVVYKNRPLLKPPRIAGESIAKLVRLLEEPEDRTRYRVRRELAQRATDKVVAGLAAWTEELDSGHRDHEHRLLEALWVYQSHNRVPRALLERLLGAKDARARAAATRVLSHTLHQVKDPLALLRPLVRDVHPRVRLEAVRACSFIHTKASLELALEVLNQDLDVYLEYTLNETVRVLEDILLGSTYALPGIDRRSLHASGGAHAHGDHAHGDHAHSHGAGTAASLVFLDKTDRVVRFQLDRLSNSQLLAIPTDAGQKKYKPVLETILQRAGVSLQDRRRALADLTKLSKADPVAELLAALGRIDAGRRGMRSVVAQLSALLLEQPANRLQQQQPQLRKALDSGNASLRRAAYAALVVAGKGDSAWNAAEKSGPARVDFLRSIALLPSAANRIALRDRVVECLERGQPVAVQRAALETLAEIPSKPVETFRLAAKRVGQGRYRSAAVHTLAKIPKPNRPADAARSVVQTLVQYAEKTPAARRTTPPFLDAMNLVDQLLPSLPVEEARRYRARLRETVVRVIRINTVEEEMRYDKPYFAVEAGRPVQIVLRNEDLMPHNLVITTAGSMRSVAEAAAQMPPRKDRRGRIYVPRSPQVLQATKMVEPHRQTVLTFKAPSKPGEYPYVCTFPRHWMRMYGVMVVVKDLDAWLAKPTKPKDPLGLNRDFVKAWKTEDLQDQLDEGLRGRSLEIGRKIFTDASCAQCHKMNGKGGAVGPELTDVLKRWKGDRRAVLREILDPAHRVEEKYALYNIQTVRGNVLSGVITRQDRRSITLVSNPEKPEPRVIPRGQIDEMVKTSSSLMPKGLLNRFTRDEVFELLHYILKGNAAK